MDANCFSPVADLVLFCYDSHHVVPNILKGVCDQKMPQSHTADQPTALRG